MRYSEVHNLVNKTYQGLATTKSSTNKVLRMTPDSEPNGERVSVKRDNGTHVVVSNYNLQSTTGLVWNNVFTMQDGVYYFSMYIYVNEDTRPNNLRMYAYNAAENRYWMIDFINDGTIDFIIRSNIGFAREDDIDPSFKWQVKTWYHVLFILNNTENTGSTLEIKINGIRRYYNTPLGAWFINGQSYDFKLYVVNPNANIIYDRIYFGTNLAEADQQSSTTDFIPFKDGDLAGNPFLESEGYFRNIGSPKIDPIGIGTLAREIDQGAITFAGVTEEDILDYASRYTALIERTNNTGAMWRVVEERPAKPIKNPSYFAPQYQKTLIIERQKLI